MDKPNKPYPTMPPASLPQFMPLNIPDHSIRGESFDQLLANRGIRFIHRKAVPCPNIKSPDLRNHDPSCPFCDASGLIYYDDREIFGVFSNNTLEKMFEVQGIWEIGAAVVSFPTQYPDGAQADFNTFDQLIEQDFEFRTPEQKEYQPTPNNQQQLRYPVISVPYAVSIVNNVKRVFVQGVDFNVTNGNIEWLPGRQPGFDPASGLGDTVTFDYLAHPIYTVQQHMHELRASQQMDNGQKHAKRLPQQVLVKRKYLPKLSENVDGSVDPIKS